MVGVRVSGFCTLLEMNENEIVSEREKMSVLRLLVLHMLCLCILSDLENYNKSQFNVQSIKVTFQT